MSAMGKGCFFVLIANGKPVYSSKSLKTLERMRGRYAHSAVRWWDGQRYWESPEEAEAARQRTSRTKLPQAGERRDPNPRASAEPVRSAVGDIRPTGHSEQPIRTVASPDRDKPENKAAVGTALMTAPPELLELWRAGPSAVTIDGPSLQERLHDLWRMNELWEFARGVTSKTLPLEVPPAKILELFTPDALERFAESPRTSVGSVQGLLRQIVDLPIPAETRQYVQNLCASERAKCPVAPVSARLESAVKPQEAGAVRRPVVDAARPTGLGPFVDWIRSLVFVDGPELEVVLAAAASELRQMSSIQAGSAEEAATKLARQLRRLRGYVDQVTSALPSDESAGKMLAAATDAFREAEAVIPSGLGALLRSKPALDPAGLRDVCKTVALIPVELIPTWIVRHASDRDSRIAALADPEVRSQVKAVAEVLQTFPELEPPALQEVPSPPAGAELREHVREVLSQISGLPREIRSLLKRESADGADMELAKRCATETHRLIPRVSREVGAAIAEDGKAALNLTAYWDRLSWWGRTVERAEALLGSAQSVTVEQLRHLAAQAAPSPRIERSVESRPSDILGHDVSVEHDWTGRSAARAPVHFAANGSGMHGIVAVPLKLQASAPFALRGRLAVEVTTKQRQGWLSDWPDPTPDLVSIRRDDWVGDPDGKGVSYPFRLDIPIKPPARETEALECLLSLSDEQSGQVLADRVRLRWDQIAIRGHRIAVSWPEGLNPDFVRRHPIGPQRRHEQLEKRLEHGVSFAVIAPRRFGKSTLVTYLQELASRLNLICPPPVVCTQYATPSGVDYSQLWKSLSDSLQALVGSSLALAPDDPLPSQHSFDFVRQAAASRGKKGILILLDEAQLFFPRSGGHVIGDRFKDRIENSWAQPAPVPVTFGLIGLPRLSERAGANLMGLLRPIEEYTMAGADLQPLLLGVTQGTLHSTRTARRALAKSAGNLFLLRNLLDQLTVRLNAERRCWANLDDVRAVEYELKDRLRTGEAATVGYFVRDALNVADSVNDFHPDVAFPVALALALARRDGVGVENRVECAMDTLNAWCRSCSGEAAKVAYTRRQLDMLVDRLDDLGVYRDGGFLSPFLEAWLEGQANSGCPSVAKGALIRGALPQVDVPENATCVDSGGQASLHRFATDGREYALRRVVLASEGERERYLESMGILRRLKEDIGRGDDGAQFIFELEAIGFSTTDEMIGVQVYRWIDGQHLGTRCGELSALLVTHVACSLARAVRLIHSHGILHRDVCPRNIILAQPDKRPVLIDFGLARFADASSRTVLQSEFAAPEVQGPIAQWSKAADVYSLGTTLKALLAPGSSNAHLDSLLSACMAGVPDARPTADQLVESFAALASRTAVDQQRASLHAKIRELGGADFGKVPAYGRVVEKF